MSRNPMTREQVLDLLAAAPGRIAEMTAGATAAQLRTRPGPDDWSVVEVLAHLRSCADVWGDAIARIIAEDEPTIRAMDPRTWTPQTNYPDLEFHITFDAYARQRADFVDILLALPQSAWQRSATITGAGKPLTRTVHSYAERLAVHERPHLKQIGRAVAAVSNA